MPLELLVPIRADAIWLAQARPVVGPLADVERLPWFDGQRDRNGSVPHVASAINAPPFSDHQAWLEPGVHLHWALPDGLTRGATRRSAERSVQVGELWFPPAPNRWLVLRREPSLDPQRVSRAWLVESDYVHPAGTRPTSAIAYPRPSSEPGQAPFVYLGRQIELAPDTMIARNAALPRIDAASSLATQVPALTAVGAGDPLFAAHYPSCRSVFGLHDDAPPVGTPLSYSVYGWYGDGLIEPLANLVAALRNDPLQALSLLARAAKAEQHESPAREPGDLTEALWRRALMLAVLDRFGWLIPLPDLTTAVATEFPTDLLCAGATTLQAGVERTPSAAPTAAAAGIGSSPAEAVVAFLTGDDKTIAAAIQQRLVQQLADTDLTDHALDLGPKLTEARHAEQFRALRGHSIWTLRPAGTDAASARVDLPEGLAHELNLLNLCQEQYDRAQDEIDALRQELFADWSRYMLAAYPEGDADPFATDVDAIRDLIERTRLAPLESLQRRSGRLFHAAAADGGLDVTDQPAVANGQPSPHGAMVGGASGVAFADAAQAGERLLGIDLYSGEIIDGLALLGERSDFPKRTRGGSLQPLRFAPGEHLTAIFGETGAWRGFELVSKLGFETSHGRRFGPWGWNPQTLTPFRIEAPPGTVIVGLRGRTDVYLGAIGILVARPGHFDPVPDENLESLAASVVAQHFVVHAMLAEALPAGRSMTLGMAPGPRYWRPNDPVIALADSVALASTRHGHDGLDQPDGQLAVRALALTAGWGAQGDAFDGAQRAPNSVAAGAWALAAHELATTSSDGENWNALQLEWEVEMQPLAEGGNTDGERFEPGFITHSQTLPVNGVELVTAGTPALARTYQYLAGRSLLNPSIGRLMLDRLQGLPTDLAAHVQGAPDALMVLPLGGFHDHLLMQGQEPQLSITDPIGLPGQRSVTERVREAVGPLHPTTPLVDSPFHPIRSGELLIERLRVLDSFGRTKVWRPERLRTLQRMRPQHDAFDRAGLPVRIAQAARLDFRWLSAAHADVESNALASTSPVSGWLLPNELDGEIEVYAGAGQMLGTVASGGQWLTAPGDAAAPRHWREIADVALRRVVRWLVMPSTSDRIGAFLGVLDSALAGIDPKDSAQQQPRALLVGRPIAVARARLALALRQPIASDQSVAALNARIAGDDDQTQGLGDVEIPVRLGAHAQYDDGLCGYWIEDGALFRDELFMTPHGLPPGAPHEHIRVLGDEPLREYPIRLRADGAQTFVTMLLDPRGVVHADCGLLPTKSIGIPPELFAQQAADLRVTFRTRPVLTDPVDVALPLPSEPGYAWSWIERSGDDWLEVPHHPTVERAALVAGFGTHGDALWDRLVALGRIRPQERNDIGVLMPGVADAPADRYDDLGLDPQAVERGLHDLARAIGEAGTAASYGARVVARDGWLQLRAEPLPLVRTPGDAS